MVTKYLSVALGALVAATFVAAPSAMGFTRHGQSMGMAGGIYDAHASFGYPTFSSLQDLSNPGRPNGGFGFYPMWGAPGGVVSGWTGGVMMVWIPAIVARPAVAAIPPAGLPTQAVLCMVAPTNPAVSLPEGQTVVVIADSEIACQAINGTIAGPGRHP